MKPTKTSAIASAGSGQQAWWMVGYATVGTTCCAISVVLANTGLFIRPLGAAMGWSRGDVALSLSLAALVMAVATPLMGTVIDRVGSRPVIIISMAMYGVVLAALPSLIQAFGLKGLYWGYALLAGFGSGSTIAGYIRLISGWFSGKYLTSRGLAFGICSAGVPLGGAITGPLAIFAIQHFNWQGGFWILSLFPLLIGLPVSFFLIHDAPNVEAAEVRHMPLPGMTIAQAARTKPFWLLIAIVFLISSCLQGMAIHIAPLLADLGLGGRSLAAITLFNAMLAIPARLIAGRLFDRFFAPHVALVIFALPAFGALMMAGFPVLLIGLAGSMLLGVGQGAESDFMGYLVSRYFGLRHAGRIFGTIYGAFMIGIAVGPYLFGAAFDYWKSYQIPFIAAASGLLTLCVLVMLLPRFSITAHHPKSVPESDFA